jgi:myxalamid-type polyketide synthase MxaC
MAAAVTAAAPEAAAGPTFVQQLEDAPPLKRWPLLVAHVAAVAGKVLGLDPSEIDARQGLRDIGLDSLMALELRNRLQRSIDRPLRSTLAFDFPTIDTIARHLADDILQLAENNVQTGPPPSADAADLLMQIEQLSDDEVERLFASKATLGS